MEHLAQRIIDILSANSPSFPDANSTSSSSALVEDLDIIIKNGRNYVENTRNWKNSVSNYLPLYQEVIDNKTSTKAINK